MQSDNKISLKHLDKESCGKIICYPKYTLKEFKQRLGELGRLHVNMVEFIGQKKVYNTPVLGKGCIGIVIAAYRKDEKVALKIRRTDADRATMQNEAESGGIDSSIEVSGLWKIFGPNAEKIMNSDLKNVSKEELQEKTGCFVAVRDVSFKVERGEFFVLIGLSGSGKSTVVRLILRLIEPTAGKVLINGEDICTYDDKQLQALQNCS